MERPWKSGSDPSILSLFQLVLLVGGVEVSFSGSCSSCFSLLLCQIAGLHLDQSRDSTETLLQHCWVPGSVPGAVCYSR